MKTKFIENTNEQYSIREDGVVIKHYKKFYSKKRGHRIIFKDEEVKVSKVNKSVNIYYNKINKNITIKQLLFKYFNYCICKKCNFKIKENLPQGICSNCLKLNIKESKKKYFLKNTEKTYKKAKIWRDNNPERIKLLRKKTTQKQMLTISKNYIAHSLKISVKDLTDDLYHHHRDLILLKRNVAKNHNISINRLK